MPRIPGIINENIVEIFFGKDSFFKKLVPGAFGDIELYHPEAISKLQFLPHSDKKWDSAPSQIKIRTKLLMFLSQKKYREFSDLILQHLDYKKEASFVHLFLDRTITKELIFGLFKSYSEDEFVMNIKKFYKLNEFSVFFTWLYGPNGFTGKIYKYCQRKSSSDLQNYEEFFTSFYSLLEEYYQEQQIEKIPIKIQTALLNLWAIPYSPEVVNTIRTKNIELRCTVIRIKKDYALLFTSLSDLEKFMELLFAEHGSEKFITRENIVAIYHLYDQVAQKVLKDNYQEVEAFISLYIWIHNMLEKGCKQHLRTLERVESHFFWIWDQVEFVLPMKRIIAISEIEKSFTPIVRLYDKLVESDNKTYKFIFKMDKKMQQPCAQIKIDKLKSDFHKGYHSFNCKFELYDDSTSRYQTGFFLKKTVRPEEIPENVRFCNTCK